MADADLAAALKQAKSKKMFFAFVPKGSDGKLIVSKTKILPKLIAEAKKEIGGGTAVIGKCYGDGGTMVFQVAKAPSATLGAALKKVAQRDAGLTIVPNVQLAGDAEADEAEAADTATPATAPTGAAAPTAAPTGAAAPTAAPAAPSAAPGQGNVAGIQKALQKLGYDPGKIDGLMGPNTQAAIKKFQQANGLAADGIVGPKTQAALAKALQGGAPAGVGDPAGPGAVAAGPGQPAGPGAVAAGPGQAAPGVPPKGTPNLGPWQAARLKAITDLKALAAKVAATKHGSASGVVKEIQSIITRLPANPAPNDIDKLEDFVRHDDTITAAEDVPGHFHDLDIREPLLKALETLKQ